MNTSMPLRVKHQSEANEIKLPSYSITKNRKIVPASKVPKLINLTLLNSSVRKILPVAAIAVFKHCDLILKKICHAVKTN